MMYVCVHAKDVKSHKFDKLFQSLFDGLVLKSVITTVGLACTFQCFILTF